MSIHEVKELIGMDLVWHGVNDEINLKQFIASDVNWGECDVRNGGGVMVLRHDKYRV